MTQAHLSVTTQDMETRSAQSFIRCLYNTQMDPIYRSLASIPHRLGQEPNTLLLTLS